MAIKELSEEATIVLGEMFDPASLAFTVKILPFLSSSYSPQTLCTDLKRQLIKG